MSKKLFLLLFACLTIFNVSAQEELGLQLIPGLLQTSRTNPALVPDERLVIGLPNFYGGYFHTTGSIGSLLDVKDKRATLNIQNLLDELESENILKANLEVETIHAFFRLSDKVAFRLNHAMKSNNYLSYPDALPKLFWEGNSQYIGQDAVFGPDQHSFAYHEIGLGTALTFGKLTVGATGKLLVGIGDISTERTDASLFTDDDVYQLTLKTDYLINSSTFGEVLLFDTLGGFRAEYGFEELLSFENVRSGNTGFAFDLGASFDVSDKLTIAASVIDIGKINWRKDITNYYSQGNYTLEGLDIKDVLSSDAVSLTDAVDTVKTIFEFQETSNNYSTKLPLKVYLNANYQLTNKWSVAAMLYNESYRDKNFTAFGFGGHYTVLKNLSVGATYSIRNNKYDNIGLNLGARLGPLQLFAATDNIIAAIQPYESNNVNLRMGLNLIFGKGVEE